MQVDSIENISSLSLKHLPINIDRKYIKFAYTTWAIAVDICRQIVWQIYALGKITNNSDHCNRYFVILKENS